MLAGAGHAREAVAALSGLLTGRLAFGFVQPLPDRRLPGLLGAFHREHPGIELRLIEGETDALLTALATGELDAALIGLGHYDRPPPAMQSLLVAQEPVVAAVHPDYPLARRGSIPLRALQDEPMVAFTAASKQRSNLEAACRAAGFAPQIVAETSDLGVTIELIQQQIGAAVLPKSLPAGAAKVTQLSLTRPKLDRRILLVWHPSNNTPAARALLALARHHLAAPETVTRSNPPRGDRAQQPEPKC
jgi:DNA-binding transcriptional LysR family regulator